MNYKKTIKTAVAVYFVGVIVTWAISLLYLDLKTPLTFLIVAIILFNVIYLAPFLFKLFLRAKPYQGEYRQKLLNYAKEHGFKIKDLYIKQSKISNATALGILNTQSVAFTSKCLQDHPFDEIEAVMAHELGHLANFGIWRDTFLLLAIVSILSFLDSRIYNLMNPNAINLLIVCALTTLLVLPLAFWIKRLRENAADLYAINLLKEPKALGNFFERIISFENNQSLKNESNPPLLIKTFLTHPWIYDRIKLAKSK